MIGTTGLLLKFTFMHQIVLLRSNLIDWLPPAGYTEHIGCWITLLPWNTCHISMNAAFLQMPKTSDL